MSFGLVNEIKSQKSHPENIATQLTLRQSIIMAPNQWYHHQRSFYTSLVPNCSETKIKISDGCYLRKFSPDGRFLLAFSRDQKKVELFWYKGAGSGQHLYAVDTSKEHLQRNLFNCFFRHVHSVLVSQGLESLNRECSLFTCDGNYVIVSSSTLLPDEPFPHMYETFRNNESLSPNTRFALEDYSLHIVSLFSGNVTDSYSFKCDKILLSHNQGLSLCESKLAVLSTQHQTIHIFEIISGSFIPQQEIGRFCYPDDDLVFSQAGLTHTCSAVGSDENYRPFLEKWINSLKHRFLCCIMSQAEAACTSTDKTPLALFYRHFDYFNSLRIWKIQLVDNRTLLLKYTTEDIVTMRQTDPISQPAFFAFYDIESTRMIAVHENTSQKFLSLLEQYANIFRTAVSHPSSSSISCVSNCPFGRALHMKFKQTITNARYGGASEAIKRLLVQLPVCSQSFSSSPYLDLSLYRYDDKWIAPLERPKPCGDTTVK